MVGAVAQTNIASLPSSDQEQTAAYDAKRTTTLEQLGYRVLRFWNNEVTENLEAVYESILEALNGKVADSGETG